MTKDLGGRPPINLEDSLEKLKPFLQVGYSFWKSCQFAQIAYTTLKFYYDNDDSFRNKIEYERAKVNILARQNLIKAIQGKDTKMSLEWLDRMEKDDFSKRTEITGKDGKELAKGIDDGKVLKTLLESYELVKTKYGAKTKISESMGE
jgi:hypothetical protein